MNKADCQKAARGVVRALGFRSFADLRDAIIAKGWTGYSLAHGTRVPLERWHWWEAGFHAADSFLTAAELRGRERAQWLEIAGNALQRTADAARRL